MSLEEGPNAGIVHKSRLDIAGMVQKMEAARFAIETKFLDVGRVLSQAVEGIATLVAAVDDLAEALSPATIASTTQQLHDASAKLLALPGKQCARRATIGQLEAQRTILSSHIEIMRRSLAYMRAFTISIKITAGGIPSADAEFDVFAQEMCGRVESGRKEVDALEHGLCNLKSELQTTGPRAEALERSCADTVPVVSRQLHDAAGLMADYRAKIAVTTADAGALARSVRKQVMRMLVALQIGDITRQRVEHIQTGIAFLESIDKDIPPVDAARIQALTCVLLAAQLDATLNDFNMEVEQISAGLEGLSQDAAALLSLRDVAYGPKAGEAGGFLQTLERRIGVAVRLATEIEEADVLAQDIGKKAALAARILSDKLDAVQIMKSDVQYMALNTTLKSTRLGEEGRPLGIIATELRAHAGNLEITANTCVDALKILIDSASDLSSEPSDTADIKDERIGAALSSAVTCINTAASTTERDVTALAGYGEAVLNLLTGARSGLAFHGEIGDTLLQAGEDLRTFAATAKPCDANIQIPLVMIFSKLEEIYTMSQERDIQAEIAATWNIGIEKAIPSQASEPTSDDFQDVLF